MQRHGFSLVELSIVLVILGLLIGGILAGKSLIRASELQSVGADLQRYQTALHAFRDKYLAVPGDMVNAVRFWGAQGGATTDGRDGTCANLTTAATSVATCNGDGDRMIGDTQSSGELYERYRMWQHLSNAGLIEGQLSGVIMGSSPPNHLRSAIPGTNVPSSKIQEVGYGISYDSNAVPARNQLYVGKAALFGGNYLENFGAAFRNEEVWNLDTKLDDGQANSGKLLALTYGFNSLACQTSGAATATYNTARSDIVCSFSFVPGI